jgi:hypothetical protein
MGWTHYWERNPELSRVSFQSVIGDLLNVLTETGVELAGSEGDGEPYISLDEITFNGTKGLHCEDFKIKRTDMPRHGRDVVFSFCKTENLPYDLCVKCALVILKHYFDDSIKIRSDGTNEDWQDAQDLCQKCLGYGADFKLSPKE